MCIVHFSRKNCYQRNKSKKYKIIFRHLLFIHDTFDQKWMIVVACLLNVTDLTHLYILHLTVQRGFYVYTLTDHEYASLLQAAWFELNGTLKFIDSHCTGLIINSLPEH